ncbi:MAG: hormogonium polysaccharide biosynthesis protein HpsA [Chroococcidiopsidaceae cyanobacterium CP_BM_ER_R8_30]|nr:hormogonium polysaccharide biosynthesis protein HpsA [Chroococcidiopsidaceae cyanobacterium CP_BM_ER_R8_30]
MSIRKRAKTRQGRQLSSGVNQHPGKRLQRRLLSSVRRARLSQAGFVLPTVVMVSLVVVLLTTAIMLRSFDRARNASDVRVNQVVFNAANPGIDRARAKIDALLNDSNLPRFTPTDRALYNVIKTNPKYTFGDETRLKLAYDINNSGSIETQTGNTYIPENDETLTTSWKFPVDTDNNGKFDNFILYGIYFRSPSRATTGTAAGRFNRARNPLEARTAPTDEGTLSGQCANVLRTSATPVGDSDWYQSGGKLKKSFFVFVASVPIVTPPPGNYEVYKGDRSFSALEFQQDNSLIPLNHNTVWFQDDLELTPNEPNKPFHLNGRIQTNANLLVGGHQETLVQLYQVSNKNSCFYQQENSKITVGGNVGSGNTTDTIDQTPVTVDLYSDYADGKNSDYSQIDSVHKSTNSAGGSQIAYNDAAYNQRIALMKLTALSTFYCQESANPCSVIPPKKDTVLAIAPYPEEVKTRFANRVDADPSLNTYNVLAEELEIYLRNRTRRVPYVEIPAADGSGAKYPYDSAGTNIDPNIFPANVIEPPPDWREPLDANNQLTQGSGGGSATNFVAQSKSPSLVKLNISQLEATWPHQQKQDGKETLLGDRIKVGNNLPALWKKGDDYVASNERQMLGSDINWTQPNDKPRYRTTQVQKLFDLGMSDRDGFWEAKAAEDSNNSFADVGGLRIITGAGIYQNQGKASSSIKALKAKSFLHDLSQQQTLDDPASSPIPNTPPIAGETTATPYTLVWSDMMPMTSGSNSNTTNSSISNNSNTANGSTSQESTKPPDLRMRATAVYHYIKSSGTNQTPIACISSYYDPSNATTAQNGKFGTDNGLPWGAGGSNLPPNPDPAITADVGSGRSNNGVVYPAPYTSDAARTAAIATYMAELKTQAKLMFPNGRIVNEPLQKALQKVGSSGSLLDNTKPLSLSENSAIDTAICSLKILDGTIGNPTDALIPHGAIKEATFLDAREVKAIDKPIATQQSQTSSQLESNLTNYTKQNQTSSQSESSSNTYDVDKNFDLPLEQRQPLEIRVTEINLSSDDTKGITRKLMGSNEHLLPYSGIIYASRDDALPDASDTSIAGDLLSATDFKLDPTRRPNGIRLTNGSNLTRTDDNAYLAAEKGLILATNLPVYIKGDFNPHIQPGDNTEMEEFTEKLVDDWGNFYNRAGTLNTYYACRPGKAGCPNSYGDTWRPVTIISDAITLLSGNFQDGFRDLGDFDLRNNASGSTAAALLGNGFFENNFVTSANWVGNDGFPADKNRNSYLTNGVTPIQRRAQVYAYATEICRQLPVSECKNWTSDGLDTSKPAALADRRYARRVAFNGYDGNGYPIPTKISTTPVSNALWFQTRDASGKASYDGNSNKNLFIFQPPEAPDLGFLRAYALADLESSNPNSTKPPHSPGEVTNQISKVFNTLKAKTPQNPLVVSPTSSTIDIRDSTTQKIELTGGGEMVIYSTGGLTIPKNGTVALSGDAMSIFVIVVNGSLNLAENANVQLNGGAVEDNVYWVVSGTVSLNKGSTLIGNVLATGQINNSLGGNSIHGRAFSLVKDGVKGSAQLPNHNQPRLVPVLQIHSPDGSPGGNLAQGSGQFQKEWLQQADKNTTFNATFVSGNSPSRQNEEPAGLQNFVRFLENWQDITTNIKGNFIQFQRSAYATAPFAPIRLDQVNLNDGSLSLFGNSSTKYPTESTSATSPFIPSYYGVSNRQWQFDTGLFSQSPDLLAQNFTEKSVELPDEFFREVGRDDPWIQTLACAADASDRLGGPGATYTQYAIADKNQRPPQCQADNPNYPSNPQSE